jgi:glycine cleavage system T protein (aminomethyltransferase)
MLSLPPVAELAAGHLTHRQLFNPLAQHGVVWHISTCQELPPGPALYPIRYSDPGNALGLISERFGSPTGFYVMADNIAGAAGWQGLSFDEQYRAVTTGAGAFPCGGMYYLQVSGPDAARVLDVLTPKDITNLGVGRAAFVIFTTPEGTVDTEALVLRTDLQEYLVSIGGSVQPPTWIHIAMSQIPGATAHEADISSFNIKGPRQMTAMLDLVHPEDRGCVASLTPFHARKVRTVHESLAWILRTRIGMEMWAEPASISEAWAHMLKKTEVFTPCGWDVLGTFRVECDAMVFGICPLDLNSQTTLWEIGQARMIRADKTGDYIGRASLLESRAKPRLWLGGAVACDARVEPAAVGEAVLDDHGETAGYITTSAFSPKYGKVLSFAHLAPDLHVGEVVYLKNGSKCILTALPFR